VTNAVQSKSYQQALEVFRATPAYQQAAVELLTDEAKRIAGRVGIDEPISGDPADIGSPARGITGSVSGPNYTFSFSNGRLYSLRWNNWFQKTQPPVKDMLEFARRPSQLDENTALQLARSWLTNLGVNLALLEAKSSLRVFHVPANSARETPPDQPRPMRPQFIITWRGPLQMNLAAGRPLPGPVLATVEILGATKQPVEISIHAPELWSRPTLELENLNELLGPEPGPAELMAKILTPETYKTIENPDAIEASLLTSNANVSPKKDRLGPSKLDPALARKFSAALLDFNSYNSWDSREACVTDDGARLEIKRRNEIVHVSFCFECDILIITRGTFSREINFDNGHDRFADLFLEAFPNDTTVREIPRKPKF
jgi:hypothetical protein